MKYNKLFHISKQAVGYALQKRYRVDVNVA